MKKPTPGEKETLTPEETIVYFRLSRRKFYDTYKKDNSFIVRYFDGRRLIIRAEFEKYLSQHPELRRRDVCPDTMKE